LLRRVIVEARAKVSFLAGVASADIADIGKGSRHATRKNRRIGVG
jgi:hypothetical protein